jgi:hypothetical protein
MNHIEPENAVIRSAILVLNTLRAFLRVLDEYRVRLDEGQVRDVLQ